MPWSSVQKKTLLSNQLIRKAKESKEEQAEEAREARAARYDTEHADIQVILDATREQLESAPAFVWFDQQNTNEKKGETVPQ